jgi:ATP-dependent RNA helicase DHX57
MTVQKVFDSVPAGVTKIVVATNIAETSITVDDVVYVIDTGRHKEVQYDASRRMAALVDVWCSKANCTQRKVCSLCVLNTSKRCCVLDV